MNIYYAETGMGCTIVEAFDEQEARSQVLQEVGTYHGVSLVRKATKEDIAWVHVMGGWVPERVHPKEVK